jgi:hypothetical protein
MPTSGVEVEACVARDTTQALAQSKCGAQQACRLRATGRSTLRRLQRRGQGMHRDGFALSCASAPRSTGTCWCTWRRRLRHQGGSSCPLMPPRTMSWWPSLHTTQAADALEGEDRRNGAARDAGAGAGAKAVLSWACAVRSDGQRTGSAEAARAHTSGDHGRDRCARAGHALSRVSSLEIKCACKSRHCTRNFLFLIHKRAGFGVVAWLCKSGGGSGRVGCEVRVIP